MTVSSGLPALVRYPFRVQNAAIATNYERAFEQRPAVYAARGQLNGAIKAGMDLRRYELATLL